MHFHFAVVLHIHLQTEMMSDHMTVYTVGKLAFVAMPHMFRSFLAILM